MISIRLLAIVVFMVGCSCLSMAKQNDQIAVLQNIDNHNKQLEQVMR